MIEFIAKYWVEVAFSLVLGILGLGYRQLCEKVKQQDAIRLGVQAMLRNMIVQAYNKCSEEKCCKIYELENVESMYRQYHLLGGNGAVTSLVERMRDMPTNKE